MRNRWAFAAKSPLEAFSCTLAPHQFWSVCLRRLMERRDLPAMPPKVVGIGVHRPKDRSAERGRCPRATSVLPDAIRLAARGFFLRVSADEPRPGGDRSR